MSNTLDTDFRHAPIERPVFSTIRVLDERLCAELTRVAAIS